VRSSQVRQGVLGSVTARCPATGSRKRWHFVRMSGSSPSTCWQ